MAHDKGAAGPIWQWPVTDLVTAVKSGQLRASELVETCVERIERSHDDLNAFVHTDAGQARAAAADIDSAVARGDDPGPLAGIPFGVKELEPVEGWPYTSASKVFEHRVAEYTSTQVTRLRAAGAIPIGLTAAPELGSLAHTRSVLHGTTHSPWNLERTPGGSSGGTAAALAAGLVPMATGSDGGGSIRIPAAYSGLFGIKVTWGRVSEGPRMSSGDLTGVRGPLSTTVRDAARYLDCVVGIDVHDRWSLPHPGFSYEERLDPGALRGLRAAWSSTLGYAVCDPEVEKVAHEAAMHLVEMAGLELVERPVDLPPPGLTWSILGSQDVFRTLAPYWPDCADVLTPAIRMAMESSDLLNRRRYVRSVATRIENDHRLADLFSDIDLLLTPTTATVAFPAGGPMPAEIAGQAVSPMLAVPYTQPFNLGGQPAVSIPAGFNSEGLPVGLQVVARHHEDHVLLAAAAGFEASRPWPRFAPYAMTIEESR